MIIDTTYSPRGGVFGGLPAWQVTYVITWTPADMAYLEKYMVPQERLKLTVMPNKRELVAMRTDGQLLVPVVFYPTPYSFSITEGILIGPADVQMIAPAQPSGTYAGYAIAAATMIIQQTKPNDY